MAKKNPFLNSNGSNYLAQLNLPSSDATTEKAPSDISGGRKNATGFYQISCNQLEVFSLKEDYDFSPWASEKFEELLASVKEFGVLHPIIVRHNKDKEGFYEILAGEHRWKASCLLNLTHIPAQIILDCDDEKAKSIFAITNIVSRELTLEDKIQGWSHYYDLNKEKSYATIQTLRQTGVLDGEAGEDISRRQIFRFHKINQLESSLKQQVFDEKISIHSGEILTSLDQEAQDILSPYASQITSSAHVKRVMDLYEEKVGGYAFDEKGLAYILSKDFTAPKAPTLHLPLPEVKKIMKQRLLPEQYGQATTVLEDALDMYVSINGQKNLLEKAMAEYLKNHPEEQKKLGEQWQG